ncbi:hypothetical protein AAVH_11743 [Aphelenchoides avenae]|nr:hypothetical protein AAVH_11743 [Aphelenchus avenae]
MELRIYDLESENIRLRRANANSKNTAKFAEPGASAGIRTSSPAKEASHSSDQNTLDGVPVVNIDVDGSFIRRAAQQSPGSEPDNSSSSGSPSGNYHSATGQQVPRQDLPWAAQHPPSTHDRAQAPQTHPLDRNVRLVGMAGRRGNVPVYDCGICRTAQIVGDQPAAQHIAGAQHMKSAAFLRRNGEGF